MANLYETFCETIEAENAEQADWLVSQLSDKVDEGEMQRHDNDITFNVLGQESSRLVDVTDVVVQWQVRFNITAPWVCSYIIACDKPLRGENEAGAVVIHKGVKEWICATAQALDRVKQLKEA